MTLIHRILIPIMVLALAYTDMQAKTRTVVVADSATHKPLAGASVFDSRGSFIGITDAKGRTPHISAGVHPITIRFLGFREKVVADTATDSIFLQETFSELPEVVVESRRHKVFHMLAYVREYSTLSTYTDTVFLFREKTVDYMLSPDRRVKFKGWESPRVLSCRSYYRFTNAEGLDSVSDVSNHHFSWSDWMGVAPSTRLPQSLVAPETATDTLRGKYSPSEIWTKNRSRVTVDVNVLADTVGRKWVPNLSVFFRNGLDFENFRVRFNYDNIDGDSLAPVDLTGYTYTIESNGRGHNMFMFNRVDEPFFVSTYAEVYIMDKEYITVKEARKWEKRKFLTDEIGIYEPLEAPELQPAVCELVDRVARIDKDRVRLDIAPDERLVSHFDPRRNFKIGRRALGMLKQLTGITLYKSHRNFNNRWDTFRRDRARHNTAPPTPAEPED